MIKLKTKTAKDVVEIDFENPKSVMRFLQQPTLQIAEFLTGILASDTKDFKLSAGHLVQAVIKGDLLTQLGREIKTYQKAGKVKQDILKTDINRASFKEMLGFIDSEAPDDIRFKAMKSVFLTSISGAEESLAYELLQICKQLSSGEILVLKAAYDIVNSRLAPNMPGIAHNENKAPRWFNIISQQIGHHLPHLVEIHEDHLTSLKLIGPRMQFKGGVIVSDFESTQHFRLTPLGMKLCEFITKYE